MNTMENFYIVIAVKAEGREEAERIQEELAGSNDGSEAIANAVLRNAVEMKAVFGR